MIQILVIIRFYACTISRAILWSRLETTTNRSSVRPSVPSISAVVILPHAPPDPFGPAPAANDSVPPVRAAIGFRAGTQEETEAAFRRPRRAAAPDRAGPPPRTARGQSFGSGRSRSRHASRESGVTIQPRSPNPQASSSPSSSPSKSCRTMNARASASPEMARALMPRPGPAPRTPSDPSFRSRFAPERRRYGKAFFNPPSR